MKIFVRSVIVGLLLVIAGFATSAQTNANRPLIVVGSPTPSPTQTPTATVSPTPARAAVQTPFDLTAKIRTTLARPELRRGTIGLKIAVLDTGAVVFEENAEKYFIPASNMKSFTVAAALERLTPDFRFVTSVRGESKPDSNGVLKGNLTIFGRGDVSFSRAFYGDNYFGGLDLLADRIVASGVRRIEGDLVADETYFSGSALPVGWEWDDLQWYSGAEVSAFPLNDNVVSLRVRPTVANAPCHVEIEPANVVYQIINRCLTTPKGAKSDLSVTKSLDRNILEIGGTVPVGDNGFTGSVTVTRPAELYISLLLQRLRTKGVEITGRARALSAKEKTAVAPAGAKIPVELVRLESPPLSVIAQKTMKPSQNMYTEVLLWTLGEEGKSWPYPASVKPADNPFLRPSSTSSERGVFVVRNFLQDAGVTPDGVVQYDGSGLSRHNLITPAALIELYTYMARKSRFASVWYDSLPIGGVDGTLSRRFSGVRTNGNVRGKTGTLDQVSALSGYVTTAGGQRIVFSAIVNGVPSVGRRMAIIDEIVTHVAQFDGQL